MKHVLFSAAVAVLLTTPVAFAATSKSQQMSEATKYDSYVGTSSKSSGEVHIFRNLDEAVTFLKAFLDKGMSASLQPYNWTRKGEAATQKFEVLVPSTNS